MAKRPLLTRTTSTSLEVRGTDGRTVYGLCCPFDTPATIADASGRTYVERIKPGAFARTREERGAGRVKFLAQHARDALRLGSAVVLEEQQAGLWGEFAISQTRTGDAFAFDYTFVLNVLFLSATAALGWILWRDPDRPPLTASDDVVERILFWLASLAIIWLVGGLTIAPLLA